MILLKKLLSEVIAPYPKATFKDPRRGYLGTVQNGRVVAYDTMIPDVLGTDHSELPNGRMGSRWRYFEEQPSNVVLWDSYPPSADDKHKVEDWLYSHGVKNPRHIAYKDYVEALRNYAQLKAGKWE